MRHLARGTVVALTSLPVVAALAWLLGSAWLTAQADIDAAGPASADELLTFGAASLALAVAGWLALTTGLELLAHIPGRVGASAQVWSARLTPALARRAAAFILGVGVGVVGGPSQALAGPRVPKPAATSFSGTPIADPGFAPITPRLEAPSPAFRPAADPAPHPGFTPVAPRVRPQVDPGLLSGRAAPAAAPEAAIEVVVHRGDSLWSIAARHLGPHASDAEIARAWPQWFELNRGVIGSDPDVILPGQVLRAPSPDRTASVTR